MSRDKPLRTTKSQRRHLYNCHVGVGFLVLKVSPETIVEVEVCTIKGQLCRIKDGRPVFPIHLADEDENGQRVYKTVG